MNPASRADSEHYTWGENSDGWHLLKDPNLSVIQESMPPHTTEVRHYHGNAQQFFFLLTGEAAMEVNGDAITLCAGEGVHIPPRRAHQIRNVSDRPVEFLVISQPSSHGDRVAA